jgi:hypothetical protein
MPDGFTATGDRSEDTVRTNLLAIAMMAMLSLAVFAAVEAHNAKKVYASGDCPVTNVVQHGAGATVTFDCGQAILTIEEPIWP